MGSTPKAVAKAVGTCSSAPSRRQRDPPLFAAALRACHTARLSGNHAIAEGLLAWLMGQPHVGADQARGRDQGRPRPLWGQRASFAASRRCSADRPPGLVLVLDEVETIQRVRADSRKKSLNALRQLIDDLDAGHYPGMYVLITGTPQFFEGPQGVRRLPALEQRLHVDSPATPRSTTRVRRRSACCPSTGSAAQVGRRIRELYPASSRARIATHVDRRAPDVASPTACPASSAARWASRRGSSCASCLVDLLDKVDEHATFDPTKHYKLVVDRRELTPRSALAGVRGSVDDIGSISMGTDP
jgi:hypothetical protein